MTTTVVQQQTASTSPFASRASLEWHFPGPSSRYNKRERAKTHSRLEEQPLSAAPFLHTERRAHRRAQSSNTVPRSNEPRFFNVHSRQRSFHHMYTRSPIECRSPLSRFSSFDSTTHLPNMLPFELSTPPKGPQLTRQHSAMLSSPFSDYCTDENGSIDGSLQLPPTAHKDQLLLRLNKLTAAVLGESDPQRLHVLERGIRVIEHDMDSSHSQSRQPPELAAGLFDEEQQDGAIEEKEVEEELKDDTPPAKDEVLEMARITLSSLNDASNKLQLRVAEFKAIRSQFELDSEEKGATIVDLQNQLQHMRTDRAMDQSEMLLYRTHFMHFVQHARAVGGRDALELTNGLLAVSKDWQQTLRDMEARDTQTSEPRWQTEVNRLPDGRVEAVLIKRMSTEEDQGRSNLSSYIESVGNMIHDAMSKETSAKDAGTQTDVQPPESWDAVYRDRDNLSRRMSSETRSLLDMSGDSGSFLRGRPILTRPDDDDAHSCAITTSPASEADPSESAESAGPAAGGFAGIFDIFDGLLDHDSDPDEQVAAATQDIESEAEGKGPWEEFMQSLTEYALLGGR